MTGALSPKQIERLKTWKGYGNPSGKFWFIGMEEGGSPPLDELIARADLWRLVEDLADAPRPWRDQFDLTKSITPVWDGICRITGFLSDEPDWIGNSFVRKYQADHLGRLGGETFLTEVLPLPKRDVNAWPYGSLWATKREYEEEVRPSRIEMLQNLWAGHQPEYTICYGKTNWTHYREIFPHRTFSELIPGESEVSVDSESNVLLMQHFSAWDYTNAQLAVMLEELVARGH